MRKFRFVSRAFYEDLHRRAALAGPYVKPKPNAEPQPQPAVGETPTNLPKEKRPLAA